jgi:hypothetical protein
MLGRGTAQAFRGDEYGGYKYEDACDVKPRQPVRMQTVITEKHNNHITDHFKKERHECFHLQEKLNRSSRRTTLA